MWKKDLRTILLLLFFMFLFAVLYSLSSCTRTVEKSVVTHDTIFVAHHTTDTLNVQEKASDTVYVAKTDTFTKTEVHRDSVVIRDSVFVREKGDSVFVYKEKWRTRIDIKHDTVYKSKTDTVWQSKTDTVIVFRSMERQDSAYQSKTDKEKVVKERRTLGWLKVLGVFALVFGALGVWRWLRRSSS